VTTPSERDGAIRKKKTQRDPARAPASAKADRGLVAYLKHRHDPLTSLVLTIPVFLVYHLGILLIDVRNGVDLVSVLTIELLRRSVWAYIGVTLAFAAGLVLAGFIMRKRGAIKPAALPPVVAESAVWSVLMMMCVGWATAHVFSMQIGPRTLGPFEKLVMAAGAGFHEEIVFRVLLFAGGAYVLSRFLRRSRTVSVVIAALVSSVLFSLVHYIGALGDTFTIMTFTFRILAGLFLVGVYHFRGFAVAVYTHAFYDLLVFFFVGRG